MTMSTRRKVHLIGDEAWPTQQEAQSARWFQPLALTQHCTLATRTWIPAMVPWRASAEGDVTDAVLEWYARFAMGQPGAIVLEATGIRDIASGPLLRISHDRFVPQLKRLVETVREHSHGQTRVFVQLIDFLPIRRRPEPRVYFERYLHITSETRARLARVRPETDWISASEGEIRHALAALDEASWEHVLTARELESLTMGYRERVTDMHLDAVRSLPDVLPGLFAQAAVRAREAGFDGVELHYAHAYTMASFLSARNTREDGYGGSIEGRVRLPLEVYRATRNAVGNDFVIGCRMLGEEVISNGSSLADATRFALAFAHAGMNFLSISKGGKFEDAQQPRIGEAAYPYTGPSGHECMPTVRIDDPGPFGRNLYLSREIRRAVREAGLQVPIVGAGGINAYSQAEAALARGDADILASARQALADPDWWRKIREGRGHEIRRCKFTNYCEALDQLHKQVTCQLWDKIRPDDLDAQSVARTNDGRRRRVAPVE